MSNIAIQRVGDDKQRTLPIFAEIEKQFNEIRRRAMELFERRGREFGHALDDWLKAERELMGKWSAAELKEKDGKYELEMTLPGYEPKEIEVTATPSEIIVHAETKYEKKAPEGKVVWTEFGSHKVYRCFEFPESIDVDKTNATLDKGILHVVAAKAPAKVAKQIEVAA
jgi:HSP20 family protein